MGVWWWPVYYYYQYLCGLCPAGQVAFVDLSTSMARSCTIGQATTVCPAGYTCQLSSTGLGICCGAPGQCPAGSTPYTDSSGRFYSCAPGVQSSCLRPSTCQTAVGGPAGQYLCCTLPIGGGQCPSGFTMQNNQMIQCNPASPTACSVGSSCLPSPTQSNLFLCCQFGGGPPTDGQQCPAGYRPQGGTVAPACSPVAVGSCIPGAQCLQSPSRPSMFYCCVSFGAEASQCPPNYTLQDGLLTQCSPASPACKPNSACLQSPSNPSLFICCTYGLTPTSPCPQGFTTQNNLVTTCAPSVPNACQFGSSCLQSPTNPAMYLCCTSSGSGSAQQCPVGFVRQDNQYVQCDPITLTPCHSNNFCLPATNAVASSFLCCSSTEKPSPNLFQCPVNYAHQDGYPIQCSPQNPGHKCSPTASCLGTVDQQSVSICCVTSTSSPGQCPPGYQLQNNAVAQCSSSFATCLTGSQCLASPINPNYFLCCTPLGSGGAPTCPLGFSLPSSTPQICTPGSGSAVCPSNSQCIQSQNQQNIYVCCQAGGLSGQFQCPGNGQPSMSGSTFTFCTPGTSSTCPNGYACQPATNAPGVAICCTSGGLPPTCPGGATPVPMSGLPGHYAYCTLTSPTCPGGSNCQTATNMVNTHICCSPAATSTSYACPHDYTPLVDPTGLVTFCSSGGGPCPPPSTCLQAANNPQFFICCQQFGQSAAQCPVSGSTPLYISGAVQTCASSTTPCPQVGYTCQQSSNNQQYICCSTGPPGGVQCANGQQIYQPGSISFFCNPALSQCPASYDCLPSTLSNQHVCCTRSSSLWQCVSGRQPFPNAQTPQTCNPQNSVCPTGTSCELSASPNQFICCANTAAQSKCPAGASPFLEGLTPRRCTGPSDLSCPPPYTCAPSDQPNVYICCQFGSVIGSSALRCFSGAPAFLALGSNQAQTCTLAAQNCPPGFSCQASTSAGVTICCGAAQQNAFTCPDGTPALIQGTNPIICSNPGVFCPPPFACVPTSTSPGNRVCCAVSGSSISGPVSGAVAPATAQVCGPGQQPYFVNNQPQTCQIGSQPSCADGFICQQGPGGVYYCCQGPRCPSGVTLLETNGHPRYCNPASTTCPIGASCHQSVNLPGNYICCMTSVSQSPTLSRCIGRNTFMLPAGRPQMCTNSGLNVCPPGYECSSFTTTNEMICCSTVTSSPESSSALTNSPVCPEGDPYRDPLTKQFHFCANTNYACPEGFVCKQAVNTGGGAYVCCSGKTTCQKGWIPFLDRLSNLPLQCSPFDKNACKPPGPPYKCQQSTSPGQYLCCTESYVAMSNTDNDNDTVVEENEIHIKSTTLSTLTTTPIFRWRNGGG